MPVPEPLPAPPREVPLAGRGPRAVLRLTPFRKLYTALVLSSFGDWLGFLATTALAAQLVDSFEGKAFATGGVLLFHISNRVFDLKPVLRSAADDLDLSAAVGTGDWDADGATQTEWVALSREPAALAALSSGGGWAPLPREPSVSWTDDHSSVLSVLR